MYPSLPSDPKPALRFGSCDCDSSQAKLVSFSCLLTKIVRTRLKRRNSPKTTSPPWRSGSMSWTPSCLRSRPLRSLYSILAFCERQSSAPGGASLQMCRSICRRAERSVVPLVERDEVDSAVQRYLNRLSDFFYVASRWSVEFDKVEEIPWVPHKQF